MTIIRESHEIDESVTPATGIGEISHLDLDAAIEHARQLRADHFRSVIESTRQALALR